MKKTSSSPEGGFSLLEALISITLVFYIVVMILSGFTNQLALDKDNGLKNMAIALAESKLEEYMKSPATKMPVAPASPEYIWESKDSQGHYLLRTSTINPNVPKQMRRTVTLTSNIDVVNIQVVVDYSYSRHNSKYRDRITLRCIRGG